MPQHHEKGRPYDPEGDFPSPGQALTSVRFDEETLAKLRLVADAHDLSVAGVIRWCVARHIVEGRN